MRYTIAGLVLVGILFLIGGNSSAQDRQQKLQDQVAKGCSEEIQKYCSGVKEGQGRILACLYAHEDSLSGRCEYALYDASVQLERAVNALTYAASECRDDLRTYCANIEPGGGRLLECLNRNSAQISPRCDQALKDTNLK